jgi:hypothetical protein
LLVVGCWFELVEFAIFILFEVLLGLYCFVGEGVIGTHCIDFNLARVEGGCFLDGEGEVFFSLEFLEEFK